MSGWINLLSFKSARAHVPARENFSSHATNFTPLGTPTQGQNETPWALAPAMAEAMISTASFIVPRMVLQQDGCQITGTHNPDLSKTA
mmetsp:Transcript_120309/g.218775  ORF Transcript_120309/g.218775 Transcript_120309/m.218775 type:complete len:88 (+) Transcript_120309:499-762(+)